MGADQYPTADSFAGGVSDVDTFVKLGRRMIYFQEAGGYNDSMNAEYFRIRSSNITCRFWLRHA